MKNKIEQLAIGDVLVVFAAGMFTSDRKWLVREIEKHEDKPVSVLVNEIEGGKPSRKKVRIAFKTFQQERQPVLVFITEKDEKLPFGSDHDVTRGRNALGNGCINIGGMPLKQLKEEIAKRFVFAPTDPSYLRFFNEDVYKDLPNDINKQYSPMFESDEEYEKMLYADSPAKAG